MALSNTVLACRRSGSAECLIQSVIGVAFRDSRTLLLSPADQNVCTCVGDRPGVDAFDNPTRLEVFYCWVGRLLDELFPEEQDFEIFRLHYDAYRVEREEDVFHGELMARWRMLGADGIPLSCVASIEHLWGGYFAARGTLIDKLYTGTWEEVIYRSPKRVALSLREITKANLGYIPHPGLDPAWHDDISRNIATTERLLRTARPIPERLM